MTVDHGIQISAYKANKEPDLVHIPDFVHPVLLKIVSRACNSLGLLNRVFSASPALPMMDVHSLPDVQPIGPDEPAMHFDHSSISLAFPRRGVFFRRHGLETED